MRRLELLIPPAVVLLIFVVVMWLIAFYFTVFSLAFKLHTFVSVVVAILGFSLILMSSAIFYRRNTTLNPLKPELASVLVTSGFYRYSRNPIYGGFVLILLGWGIYLQNLASLLSVILFVLYLCRFQINPEEKLLEQKFGAEFEKYKSNVNRWL